MALPRQSQLGFRLNELVMIGTESFLFQQENFLKLFSPYACSQRLTKRGPISLLVDYRLTTPNTGRDVIAMWHVRMGRTELLEMTAAT